MQSMLKHQKFLSSQTPKDLKTLHKSKINSIAWNSNGSLLATASADKSCKVFSYTNIGTELQELIELIGHTDSVTQLVWHPSDPNQLATASSDRCIRVWKVSDGSTTVSYSLNCAPISLIWSLDGLFIAALGEDDKIAALDLATGSQKERVPIVKEINEIQWSADGSILLMVTGQGNLLGKHWPSLKDAYSVTAHNGSCYCIATEKRGKFIATGGADAIVSIWDVGNKPYSRPICINTFDKHESPIRCLGFSANSHFLGIGGEDCKFEIVSAILCLFPRSILIQGCQYIRSLSIIG